MNNKYLTGTFSDSAIVVAGVMSFYTNIPLELRRMEKVSRQLSCLSCQFPQTISVFYDFSFSCISAPRDSPTDSPTARQRHAVWPKCPGDTSNPHVLPVLSST